MDRDLENEVQIQITEAIKQHDIAAFHRIVDSHPEWPTHDNCLGYPHDIAAYRLDTFKAFVARFPQTKDWHCGHSGNPVGLAALVRDVELLRALLEDVGCCANKGWFYYRPILYVISTSPAGPKKAEIMELLKKHGATLEGEGYVYQRSHRLWNGRRCWHKWGQPRSKCSWEEKWNTEWDKMKGPMERVWNFFGVG